VQKKENDGKEKMERERVETGKSNEERESQTRQKASPISQTCPICVVCKINHALPCHTVLPRSPGGPTIFKSTRSHAVIQLLKRNFSPI